MYKKQTNRIMRGLSALVLSAATFCGVTSADAQIVIDGHFADWDGINAATVDDAKDMADSSGDIRQIQAHVEGGNLHLSMSVHGIAAPSVDDTPEGMKNRYYYHWLFDTDNDTATGFKNDAYEGNPTGLAKPVGVDLVVMIGWRDGKPNGLAAYDPLVGDDSPLVVDFAFNVSGDTISAVIPLADLKLTEGQSVGFSAFQEGASDGWSVDWVESASVTLSGPVSPAASVNDPKDMADSSGDIKNIKAVVKGDNLHLSMSVHGVAAPSVDDTPEGMKNRYYYHWLFDTDNDTATGFKNDAYEGNPTGLAKPIGVDLVVQFGWRDGKPNGLTAYDPLVGDDSPLVVDFAFNVSGDTINAVIPLADLKLTAGQSVGFSAFQEGASDGWSVDWVESDTLTLVSAGLAGLAEVSDPKDMADSSGDIRNIQAIVQGSNLFLRMTVDGLAAPSVDDTPEGMKNRYYYHWLLDTDNDTATGFKNDAYEGNPTGLAKPIGVDLVVMIGWRDGKPNGIAAYDPLVGDDSPLVVDFTFATGGNSVEASIPLADLGLTPGQAVGFSAFQEGASDGWSVDWVESAPLTLKEIGGGRMAIDGNFEDWIAPVAEGDSVSVDDPKDMADSSGDIKNISAHVEGDNLHLSMSVYGIAAPSVDDTPEGMKNRYYYHWLFDTDNDTATGFKNDAYEGNPTGLAKPVGVDLVVMIGWRDGKPNGLAAYDPLVGDDSPLVVDFAFNVSGDTINAVIPLSDLKLTAGQSVGFSAFQEGASDGWSVDWVESDSLTLVGGASAPVTSVDDPKDMADSSGDIKNISAHVEGDNLHLSMSVYGIAAPSVDDTPEGMKNRYYYHWLFDTDNDTATGFKNDAYEGNPTGLAKPVGVDLVVMIGWRDGKPNGLAAYDPLVGDDSPLVVDFAFNVSGDTINAVIPLADLKLTAGQSVGFSAFQEGASDGWSVDWVESDSLTLVGGASAPVTSVDDPKDMADSSGDIKNISAHVEGDNLHLSMSVYGIAAPSVDDTPEGMKNRYYYHWLFDTDNDTATGFKNDAYEGNPTGLAKPVGVDLVVMIGWRDGKPNGLAAYDPLVGDDSPLVVDFAFNVSGDTINAVIPLSDLKLTAGQSVGFSAFQEGASDGWSVDWVESDSLTLEGAKAEGGIASVDDPKDMADSSGDIKQIQALVENGNLYLRMSVYGIAAPSVDDTPEGMKNRYYYHWLFDTDNDTATGFKNDAYEGNPTGLAKPIGVDLVVQFGWRDGKPNGLAAYDPLVGDDSPLVVDYTFATGGDSVEAVIPLSDLGLTLGQSVGFSAFQEGASDGWSVDWVESTVVTLSQDTKVDMTLETLFAGNAYGFEIQVMDDGDTKVDAASVSVSVDGASVEASVAQANGMTLITGQNPALLPEETAHTVSLTLDAGGAAQSKDFVFIVGKYTYLPEALNLGSAKKESGFLVGVTQISSATTLLPSIHENKAELAEKQLAGKMLDPDYEDEEVPYVNEAHEDAEEEFVVVYDTPDIINWFEQAPGEAGNFRAGLGFEDELFPFLPGWNEVHDGVVIEIRAYLDLEAGSHKIGMNGEGGWKVSGGTDASGILVGVYDNSEIEQVPTYYPLDQYVDIVVTKAGLYPIRVLWFQSRHNKAPGMQLEIFTVKDRAKHLLNDPNDPLAIKAYRAGDLLPFVVPEGIESAGLTRVVNDKIIFETDTANQNNWEPFSSVIGNSTFVVEANTFADPEEDYNQRYMLAFQPVGGGEAKMGEVFHGDDGSPYTGKINGSRQNGNPGRVAGDPRPGSVNFIAGGEASPHMFGEFQSDNRWDLGVDRLADGRYGAVQTYSLDPETLEQTPLSNAIDAINGRLTEGSPPGNQVGRFGGDMVPLSNGNFAVVVEDRSGFHTDGTAATAVIIAPNGSIVRESFVIESGSIWSNVASFKGGWAARVGGVIYFFDNAGDLVGESEQADSGVSFDGGRGDGTRIYGHINSPYLFMAGPGDGRVQLAVWDSRDQSFVTSIPVSEADYKASFERVNLASDALNRVVVAYESKPTAEGKEYEQHQVTVRVMAFDAANGTFSHLTPSFFAFTNQAASGIRTVRPTVAMTTKEILIAAKGEINRANKPEDGPDTEPQTTFYTVFSHPDPQEDPTPALVPPIYPAPDGGWAYSLDTSMAKAGEDGSGFTSLDGTWSHDNGSDQWDGSAIGGDFGDGNRPGGVNALDGFIRLQETGDPRDYGYSDSGSNRKLYFGKDITELGVSDTILDDGVTLHFKIRVPTDGPLDQLHPDGGGGVTDYPASGDTYKLHNGEKGHIGIYQGAGGLISFTLTDGGLMIREDGSEILGLDPTTWHEFWVTIEADNVGAGTHKVSVYVDGLSPEVFSINKGGGKDFNIISYLAIGLGSTSDSGALDVAAFDFAAGVKVPVTGEPAPAEPPALSIVNNGNGSVTVTFEGKLQAAASVNGPWADVAGATSPLTISANEAQQYARAVRE